MGRLMAMAIAFATLSGCVEDRETSNPAAVATEIMLTEELRIGGLDGPEEYTFGYVTAIAPAPDGTILISDRQGPVLRRYDAEGQFVANIGRDGEGPGEYRSLDGVAALTDGTVVVWDGRLRRLSQFDAEGEYLRSSQIAVGLSGWRSFVWSPEGEFFIRTIPVSGFVESPEGTPADWARITIEGDIDRYYTIPLEEPSGPRYVLAGRGGYYRPFNIATLSAMSSNGTFYHVRNDEYAIQHLQRDSSATVLRRDEPRIEVSPEEMAEWEARSESFAQRSPDQRSSFFPIPELKPYIRELVVDLDGRLWVSRYTEPVFMEYSEAEAAERREQNLPSYQWRDSLRWDIFSPEDEFLGYVVLPLKTSFVTAIDDVVWGVQEGEYREDYVVRWRMGLDPS